METEGPIRVAVVEDNTEFLHELSALLDAAAQTTLVGRYTRGADAIGGIARERPDVTLIDLGLPDMTGVEVIRRLRQAAVDTEFLVITVYDDDRHLFAALEAGAVGYIVKERAVETGLIGAIEDAVQGGAPMSLGIARRVLARFHRDNEEDSALPELTRREREVLEHLANGFNTKKAAEMLSISYGTIRCHQKSIYRKLHVSSLLEAVTVFRNSG
jgi:DNA-binding NarL/FixJ family response regulator